MENKQIKDTIKKEKKVSYMRVWRVSYYKNCPVYLRQIGWATWEYLTVINNEIYSSYYIFKPKWYKFFVRSPYTVEQIKGILNLLTAAAQTTIDTVEKKESEVISKVKKRVLEGKGLDK